MKPKPAQEPPYANVDEWMDQISRRRTTLFTAYPQMGELFCPGRQRRKRRFRAGRHSAYQRRGRGYSGGADVFRMFVSASFGATKTL
jgi:hypothetical protein